MRRPFELVMQLVAERLDTTITLGELSRELGEPIDRIMDAIDAIKVCAGEMTYIDCGGEAARRRGVTPEPAPGVGPA